jgi:hypothetical protein
MSFSFKSAAAILATKEKSSKEVLVNLPMVLRNVTLVSLTVSALDLAQGFTYELLHLKFSVP